MGGSEILHLVTHKDKLFASVGYWEDENNIWYGGNDFNLGWAQIIRLDNADGIWEVDFDLGLSHLRPEILKEVIFTKDYYGNPLDTPDTLLMVGAYSPNFLSGSVTASIFIRNDENGEWDQIVVHEGGFPAGENYSMRDIELYTDQITGIEHLIIENGLDVIKKSKEILVEINDNFTEQSIQCSSLLTSIGFNLSQKLHSDYIDNNTEGFENTYNQIWKKIDEK